MGSPSKPPAYIHYGRGGWGNITATKTGSYRRPSHASDPRPSHSATRRFSTGIGGYANITSSKPSSQQSPEDLHSLLSSASTPGMVLSSSPTTHFGVGGYANKYRQNDDDVKAAKDNNEKYWRASVKGLDERRASAASAKSQSGKNERSESERSSKGSVAESLKDFLGGGRRGSRH